MILIPIKPTPAPSGFAEGKVVPEVTARPWSRLFFNWLDPFLKTGYSRPLQIEDLWSLPESKRAEALTSLVQDNFYHRCPPEKRPRQAETSEEETAEKRRKSCDSFVCDEQDLEQNEEPDRKYDCSLLKALFRSFLARWCYSGMCLGLSQTLLTTSPFITKLLLTWLAEAYLFHGLSDAEKAEVEGLGINKPKGIGYGIGLAFALFAMQETSSLLVNQYILTTTANGIYVRAGLIGTIFRKSLRLSGRARTEHSTGKITTMISTDTTRLDQICAVIHYMWVAPIQIAICIGLLINNLGVSALVGLATMILVAPIQTLFVRLLYYARLKGVKFTDKRTRLLTEVLQGIRLIKLYTWESFYISKISEIRTKELGTIKLNAVGTAGLVSTLSFSPIIGATMSFVTYALTKHDLNAAIIFSSLMFFNVIQAPLLILPMALGGYAQAQVALGRISDFLLAEEMPNTYLLNGHGQDAVFVDADFTWESTAKAAPEPAAAPSKSKNQTRKWWKRSASVRNQAEKTVAPVLPTIHESVKSDPNLKPLTEPITKDDEKVDERSEDQPFELKGLKMKIPKGSFVAIVGRVGSGKSSVLQAVIGEMRKTRGEVTFAGKAAYAPQTPWIRNMTLKENILFGSENDEQRFQEVVRACGLQHDIDMLPQREHTEIGEKGIGLSGGQKARVSLARAAYANAEIILLDDCLSAVDAYVGRAILENCILSGPLTDRTRILTTHSLHVLDKTDYIYVVDNGVISEEGTYRELMKRGEKLSYVVKEYGSHDNEETQKASANDDEWNERIGQSKAIEPGTAQALMQTEEREVGAVPWSLYARYLKYAGGLRWAPLILALLVTTQSVQVGSSVFLGLWSSDSISSFKQGDYIAVYISLGVGQALFSFFTTIAFFLMCLAASFSVFEAALTSVMRSPISLFDTTPIGRIVSRLSKDQDILDNTIASTLFMFLYTLSTVFGTVFLVFYTFPLLGIIFVPLTILYYGVLAFYRRTSVETKRLDSLMRSQLYESYSESLTGLSTIRAYGLQQSSITAVERSLDKQNRAYYMTLAIQCWLTARLDLFGNILVLGLGLFASGFRNTIQPSKIGVVISYASAITSTLGQTIAKFAQNEQNMNAVERILTYTALPSEGDRETPNDPPAEWPQAGQISFMDVDFTYREGLPRVLKKLSFDIKGGEKVGIIGRTGAGKSSLLQALFRVVELEHGNITIDGVDISTIGLDVLRSRLALVPQDSTMFLGTIRENLDPKKTRTDAELISILQRAWLLPQEGMRDHVAETKFGLDATVDDEGSNYSVGEKQLLSLARALVKESRIIVLDEATSSVDMETDAKLQRSIQTEFSQSTLLCIAHRLNTIAYYDRVLVMDAGEVAEFDSVLTLFDKENSIFRSLCNEAKLYRADILRIRASAGAARSSPPPSNSRIDTTKDGR